MVKNFHTPSIIYNDDSLIVISKPPAMPSISIDPNEEGTLAAWIIKNFPSQIELPSGQKEAGLVSRLDNDTSGLIIAAKNIKSYDFIRSQISCGETPKTYLALCIGTIDQEMLLDKPIAHHPRKNKKMIVCNSEAESKKMKAREASTLIRPLKSLQFENRGYTLCEVEIKTGVRHQIRAHMASIGHPISGDAIYMNRGSHDSDPLAPKRHLLHSFKISIIHPETSTNQTYEAPLASDFAQHLDKMQER